MTYLDKEEIVKAMQKLSLKEYFKDDFIGLSPSWISKIAKKSKVKL